MALKDTWIPQDNTMVADSKVINNIADAVIQNEENIKDLKENGGGGGVSQEYVDKNFVKKVNSYGLADIVAFTGADDKRNNHIFIDYGNGTSTSAEIPAYTSDLVNDSGFVTRVVENFSDWMCHELLFKRNTTTLYGEVSDVDDTLPISMLDTEAVDFESSVVFKTGDVVPPISHEGISISCAGDDCGEDGCFYPQPYRTYELHAKRLGDMFSIRVGIIVTPHTEEA